MSKNLKILGELGATVDDTLTQTGKAADAKAVGDKFAEVEEKLANAGGTGSGGIVEQVQADWEQNDETQTDYIKNRPFGMGAEVLTEILPETTLSFTLTDMSAFGFEIPPTSEQLAAWNANWGLCRVVYDGVTYDCEPQIIGGMKAVGNVEAFMGTGSNNMPFMLTVGDIYGTGDMVGIYSVTDTAEAAHPIAISLTLQEVNKLDPKFIENIDYETQIINKPFYTIPSGTVLLDETVNFGVDFDGIYAAFIDEIDIMGGATYSVEIDGTGYTAVAVDQDGIILIEYSGDDMYFMILNGYYPNQTLIGLSTQGEHTCKIIVQEDAVKKIEAQYLPDDIGGSALPEVTTSDNGKVMKVVDGVWAVSAEEEQEKELPTASTSDNGKFLRVVNGSPAWVALTDVSQEGA